MSFSLHCEYPGDIHSALSVPSIVLCTESLLDSYCNKIKHLRSWSSKDLILVFTYFMVIPFTLTRWRSITSVLNTHLFTKVIIPCKFWYQITCREETRFKILGTLSTCCDLSQSHSFHLVLLHYFPKENYTVCPFPEHYCSIFSRVCIMEIFFLICLRLYVANMWAYKS